MKVILNRGGNYLDQRFEADPDPQDVPTPFGEAMYARGHATLVPEPPKKAAKKTAAKKAAAGSDA